MTPPPSLPSLQPPELKCGSSMHELEMSPEECSMDCTRTYHLYIPTQLCVSNSSTQDIGSLPLVFAVHCLGCTADSMIKWDQIAEEFNFILVRPEGKGSSWNARYCCGYALKNKLDDVGFFAQIIDQVDESLDYVRKDMVYAVGWSNGGYMITYSAHLFRSISPIAGYQYDDIVSLNANSSTGLFQHHSLNDPVVRFEGCCTNPLLKSCCCGISNEGAGQCTSVDQAFDIWARKVNQCSGVTTTLKDDKRGIECRSGDDCISNSTLCVYNNAGHFGKGSFSVAFPMFEEVGDFFARDACLLNKGRWSNKVCTCSDDSIDNQGNGLYCSGAGQTAAPSKGPMELNFTEDGSGDDDDKLIPVKTGLALVFLLGLGFFMKYYVKGSKGTRKKNDEWEKLSQTEPTSEVELPQIL